ncbi:hypothetical protein MBLNU457_5245t1 [Dothideomycetes sp. NU457]
MRPPSSDQYAVPEPCDEQVTDTEAAIPIKEETSSAQTLAAVDGDTDLSAVTWRDYDPEGGLPLANDDLSAADIKNIFRQDINAELGNWILRLMNYRRQSGSLIEYGVEFSPERGISPELAQTALDYLRRQQPDFDERQAGATWADEQIARLEDDYSERAERLGIYQKETPDDSVLVRMKRENVARYEEEQRLLEEEREKEEMAALEQAKMEGREEEYLKEKAQRVAQAEAERGQELVAQEPANKLWIEPAERKAWVKYYEDRATITKDEVAPQMSAAKRLVPSAMTLLAVLSLCYYLHENYTPVSHAARLFPGIPPAAATMGAISATLVAVFLGYRFPPFWRFFNQYFITVPGYPRASSMVLAMFTHQTFAHMATNAVMLWIFGRYLHEDVGRGTFLAIFLASGAIGSFSTLAWSVLRQNWTTYAFGSSGAIYGVIAATCVLRANADVKFLGFEMPMSGSVFLGILTIFTVLSSRAKVVGAFGTDHAGHFGGLAFGTLAGLGIRAENNEPIMIHQDLRGNEDDNMGESVSIGNKEV